MKIEDALQRFMDNKEDCTVTLETGEEVDGKITEIGDGFIHIEEDGGLIERVINTDYIISVYVCRVPDKKSINEKKIISESSGDKNKSVKEKKSVLKSIEDFFFAE